MRRYECASTLLASNRVEDCGSLLGDGAAPAAVPPPLRHSEERRDEESAAAQELLETVMRRYECASTLLASNGPVEDCGSLLGDGAAVTAMPGTYCTGRSAEVRVAELEDKDGCG